MAKVADGRGVLQDEQGQLLPEVLDGDSQHEQGKWWPLTLGVLGRWGATPVVWVAAGVLKSCPALATATVLGGPDLYD